MDGRQAPASIGGRCGKCGRWVVAYGPPHKCEPLTKYPKGFAICQRDMQEDGKCDCTTKIGNLFGGEHAYLQYVDNEGNKWGRGFAGSGTTPERHFGPSSCRSCKKTGSLLKYGTGTGRPADSATDEDIKDCIKQSPPSKPYKWYGYNCQSWALEAAKNCGLDCN